MGRIGRDVIGHNNVRWALIFEGVNDIGVAATDAATQNSLGDQLIAGLDQMVTRLHGRGIAVMGATITPFSGEGQKYSDPEREKTRQRVNAWIRDSGRYDAVVDFDEVVRDPADGSKLKAEFDSGDHLHPNVAAYVAMGNAVDLGFFEKFADGFSGML